MSGKLAHRGPDGAGEWESATAGDRWWVALAHRRLAIIDLKGGGQPLGNEDGSLRITFNGEIYNFASLRADLEKRGHHFATRCDTEAIVHHLEEHGPPGVADLDGIFAIALWDQKEGRLLLARDRAGVKPLYYAPLPDGGVAFASELTALLELPEVSRSLDPAAVQNYLFRDYAPAPLSLISGVFKLKPGHFLIWDEHHRTSSQIPFWRPPGPNEFDPSSDDQLIQRLGDRLNESVESQLMSDVPVGVFLSGGIDSSAVAALAKRKAKRELLTFSVAFEDPAFDESQHARRVAKFIGADHRQATLSEANLLESLDAALDCWDEPVGDPSIVPTYLLSQLAARHVKVILGGDGADELWGGYPTYRAHQYASYYSKIPRTLRNRLMRPLVSALPVRGGYQSFEWKAKRFANRWDDDATKRHERWMSSTDLPDLQQVMTAFGSAEMGLPFNADTKSSDSLGQVMAHDFIGYLPGSVLAKVDRASMAHGLEVRTPMLANALIDLAFSIPAARRLKHGLKHLLKGAVRNLLPHDILARPKRGFAIPLSRWLIGPLKPRVERLLRDSPVWELGIINRSPFVDRFADHVAGRMDQSKPLWSLIVIDHWLRRIM